MVTPVTKDQLTNSIWKIFYDRLKSAVTTVNITGNHNVTIQTYESNFSDKPFDDDTYYPVLVINTPTTPTVYFTAGKEKVQGTIEVDVYSYQSESADKFVAKIQDSIETYKGTLATNGLRRLRVESVDSDVVIRGTIKVHIRRIRFSYWFYYTKTNSF